MKPDDLEKEFREIVRDSTTLFGNVGDMTPEEITAALVDSGESSENVRNEMYSRLDSFVRSIRMKGDSPPKRYLEALEQLRPPTELPKNPASLQQHAKRWVSHLLDGRSIGSSLEVAFEFRNRGELTVDDTKLLERAVARVQKRIRDKR